MCSSFGSKLLVGEARELLSVGVGHWQTTRAVGLTAERIKRQVKLGLGLWIATTCCCSRLHLAVVTRLVRLLIVVTRLVLRQINNRRPNKWR